jgi:uncharacterized protein YjbI with pentapeptide repeats
MSLTLLLRCSSILQTRDFYGSTLRFRVADSANATLTARLGDAALIFTEDDLWKRAPACSGTIYFSVRDVDAYYASIKEKVTVSWPLQVMPYGSREFGIIDCDGYGLAFQAQLPTPLRDIREPLQAQSADLTGSSFTDVKLENAQFQNVNLHQGSFTNVRLSGAAFYNVNLSEASIANSNLTGMKINGVLVSDLIQAYQRRGG